MQMRIIWGKILPGQWDAFEAAFKRALEIRGEVKGLQGQWLLRDENDPDAGYSISQWESAEDMRAFWDSKKRNEAMAVLQPFYVNQLSLSRLNHLLPRSQAHPEVMQRTAEFHYQIADAVLPQSKPIFDNATALDTAVDMLNPKTALVQ
jgi:heme-degrading monooxygenase HmoA